MIFLNFGFFFHLFSVRFLFKFFDYAPHKPTRDFYTSISHL